MDVVETDNYGSSAARLTLLILIPIIGIGGTAVLSLIRLFSIREIILNTAVAAAICIISEIPLEEARIDRHGAVYFVYAYFFGMVLSLCSAFVFEFTLPLAAPAVIIGMLGGGLIGTSSLLLFTGISTLVLYESGLYFFYVFFTGFILIMLFCREKKPFVMQSVITYSMISAVTYISCVFLSNADFTPELVFFPIAGAFLNVLVVVIMMPKIYENVLDREEILYNNILDTEYDLLQRLKKTDKREYDVIIHTSHFCDLLLPVMKADRRKTLGVCYYHRIGTLRGKNENVDVKSLSLIREREFPGLIETGLMEYFGFNGKALTRESGLVYICEWFILEIYRHLDNNEGEKPDYDKIITETMKEVMKDKRVLGSSLSINDLTLIRERFRTEKLYYDFLL